MFFNGVFFITFNIQSGNKIIMDYNILIVDDDASFSKALSIVLKTDTRNISFSYSGEQARKEIEENEIDLILLDEKLPDISGLELMTELKKNGHNIPVIFITGSRDTNLIVASIKTGAYHYLIKPFDNKEIQHIVNKVLEKITLGTQLDNIQKGIVSFNSPIFLGNSRAVKQIYSQIHQLKTHAFSSILLTGETGTGKGNLAKYINHQINGDTLNFVHISCADIQPNLLEAELFGHEKGAYTDAKNRKKGLFEMANKGVLFLDEIDALPLDLQKKLLYFLDNKSIRRLGGNKEISVDVRLIAATNANLEKLAAKNAFRKDLFFRLNMITINLPPLRERVGDVEIITKYFIDFFNKAFRKKVKSISEKAMVKLKQYSWPGNIRELKNVIERAMIFTKTHVLNEYDIILQNFSSLSNQIINKNVFPGAILSDFNALLTLEEMENKYINSVLELVKGNKTKASEILDITRTTLRNKLAKYERLKFDRTD